MLAALEATAKAESVKIVPPDEIDPDLLDGDERDSFSQALKDFGASEGLRLRVMEEYGSVLCGAHRTDIGPR